MALAAEFAGTDLEDARERFFREARTAGHETLSFDLWVTP